MRNRESVEVAGASRKPRKRAKRSQGSAERWIRRCAMLGKPGAKLN